MPKPYSEQEIAGLRAAIRGEDHPGQPFVPSGARWLATVDALKAERDAALAVVEVARATSDEFTSMDGERQARIPGVLLFRCLGNQAVALAAFDARKGANDGS